MEIETKSETTKIKFVPFHQTKDGIVMGELRTNTILENFICNVEESNAKEIIKCINSYDDLVKMLTKLEDIISGIEAEADNKGIDLSEARHWWIDARKLLDKIEDQQNEKP